MTPEERAIEARCCCGHGAEPMEVCHRCIVEAICAAVAEERKACAWLAKNWEPEMSEGLDCPEGDTAAGIAAAIRARGGPNP